MKFSMIKFRFNDIYFWFNDAPRFFGGTANKNVLPFPPPPQPHFLPALEIKIVQGHELHEMMDDILRDVEVVDSLVPLGSTEQLPNAWHVPPESERGNVTRVQKPVKIKILNS